MKKCFAVLSVIVLLAWATDSQSVPGVHQVFDKKADGTVLMRCVITGSSTGFEPLSIKPVIQPAIDTKDLNFQTRSVFDASIEQSGPGFLQYQRSPLTGPFASILWVDRDHRYGIAENVAITGDGMNIVAGWWLNAKRISTYRTMGTSTPLWEYSLGNVPQWMISVGSSQRGEAIAAAQGSMPTYEWDKSSQTPRWMFDPAGMPKGNGEAVSKDGQIVAVAGTGLLYAIRAQTGETLYTRPFNPTRGLTGIGGGGQNCVDISSNGSVILVSTYDSTYIWRSSTRQANLPGYGQTPSRLSEDGQVVVIGNFNGQVSVYRWTGAAYSLKWTTSIGGWVSAVDVSGDGSTVMAGTGPSNGGVYMFDTSSATPLWSYSNFGSYGAMTTCVDLCHNGSYGAATSWAILLQPVLLMFLPFSGSLPEHRSLRLPVIRNWARCGIAISPIPAILSRRAERQYTHTRWVMAERYTASRSSIP